MYVYLCLQVDIMWSLRYFINVVMFALAGLEQRTVQDRSYYMGLLLSKTQELNSEISKITKEIDTFEQDNATYLTYEKKYVMCL